MKLFALLLLPTLLLGQAGTSNVDVATGARILLPAGSATAPSLQWPHTGAGKLGFYGLNNTTIGFADSILSLISSGSPTQHTDLQQGNFDVYESILASFDFSFRDSATSRVYGILSGAGLTLGPFGSAMTNGNTVSFVRKADNVGGIQNNGGAEVDLQLRKNLMLAVTAPSTPAGGYGSVYVDSTGKVLSVKDDAGVVSHTLRTVDCSSGSQLVQKVNADGSVTCASPSTTAQLRRSCIIDNDTQSATVLADTQITGRCDMPAAAHLVEIRIRSDTGTPSALLEKWHCSGFSAGTCTGYTKTDMLSATLPAATGGFNACAMTTTSQTCIDGTTSSGTITISASGAMAAGDILNVKSAVITGSPTWVHLEAIYLLD